MRLKVLDYIKKHDKIILIAVYSICIFCSMVSFAFMEADEVILISIISFAVGMFGGKFIIFSFEVNRKIWGTKRSDEKHLNRCATAIIWSIIAIIISVVNYFRYYTGQGMSIVAIYMSAMLFSAFMKYAIKCMTFGEANKHQN